jgi:hypothetical protein
MKHTPPKELQNDFSNQGYWNAPVNYPRLQSNGFDPIFPLLMEEAERTAYSQKNLVRNSLENELLEKERIAISSLLSLKSVSIKQE